jgi:enamine deaminase RidA (YjgF/YER057c/UK114 family)
LEEKKMGHIEAKLVELGITLPAAPANVAKYIPAQKTGNLVFISGQDCKVNGELLYTGKLGESVTIEQGQEAARQCIINSLVALKTEIGDLDQVSKIVKLLSFVSSAPGFVEQPTVINAASELLNQVFEGGHARSAIGSIGLPFDTPVEIEMIVELKSERV